MAHIEHPSCMGITYCASANYAIITIEQLSGSTVYYGKPHAPIYHAAITIARRAAKRDDLRIAVLGDGLETDIRGANAVGLDAVFIADGIHGEDVHEMTPVAIQKLCSESGVVVRGAMRTLVW